MAEPTSTASPLRDQIADAIRDFPFDNYGLDEVDIALNDHPDDQEWVPKLADAVLAVVRAEVGEDGGES